jgi:hypothetical protein
MGYQLVAKRVGAEEAQRLAFTRPRGVLKDQPPSSLPRPLGLADAESISSLERPEQWRTRGKADVGGHAADGLRGFSDRLRRFFR